MKRALVIAGTMLLLGYAVWMGLQGRPPRAPAKFAFAAQSIVLPASTEALPAGAHADVVAANCTSCHSAAMITTQPPLKREQWEAIVKKMREVYKAPITETDVPPIVDYLEAFSERQAEAGR
jgi:cytochrome c5